MILLFIKTTQGIGLNYSQDLNSKTSHEISLNHIPNRNITTKINEDYFNQILSKHSFLFFLSDLMKIFYLIIMVSFLSVLIYTSIIGFASVILGIFIQSTVEIVNRNEILLNLFGEQLTFLFWISLCMVLIYTMRQYLQKKAKLLFEQEVYLDYIRVLNETDLSKCKSFGFEKLHSLFKESTSFILKKREYFFSVLYILFFWIFSYVFNLFLVHFMNFYTLNKIIKRHPKVKQSKIFHQDFLRNLDNLQEYLNYNFVYKDLAGFFSTRNFVQVCLIEGVSLFILLSFYYQSKNLYKIKNALFDNNGTSFSYFVLNDSQIKYRGFSFIFSLRFLKILFTAFLFVALILFGGAKKQSRLMLSSIYNDFFIESLQNFIGKDRWREAHKKIGDYNPQFMQEMLDNPKLKDIIKLCNQLKVFNEKAAPPSSQDIINLTGHFCDELNESPMFFLCLKNVIENNLSEKTTYNNDDMDNMYTKIVAATPASGITLSLKHPSSTNIAMGGTRSHLLDLFMDTLTTAQINNIKTHLTTGVNANFNGNQTLLDLIQKANEKDLKLANFLSLSLLYRKLASSLFDVKNTSATEKFLISLGTENKALAESGIVKHMDRILGMKTLQNSMFENLTGMIPSVGGLYNFFEAFFLNNDIAFLLMDMGVSALDFFVVHLQVVINIHLFTEVASSLDYLIYQYNENKINKNQLTNLIDKEIVNIRSLMNNFTDKDQRILSNYPKFSTEYNNMSRKYAWLVLDHDIMVENKLDELKQSLSDDKTKNITNMLNTHDDLLKDFDDLQIHLYVINFPWTANSPFLIEYLDSFNSLSMIFIRFVIAFFLAYIYNVFVPVVDEAYQYLFLLQGEQYLQKVFSKLTLLNKSPKDQKHIDSIVGFGFYCDQFSYNKLYISDNAEILENEISVFRKTSCLNIGYPQIIIGKSGSGKTTVFNLLLDNMNISPLSRLYYIFKNSENAYYTASQPDMNSQAVKTGIGFVPQFSSFPDHFSINDVMLYATDPDAFDFIQCLKSCTNINTEVLHHINEELFNYNYVDLFFNELGVGSIDRDREIYSLSGGQRRRVSIILSLYKTVTYKSSYSSALAGEKNSIILGLQRKVKKVWRSFKKHSKLDEKTLKRIKVQYLKKTQHLIKQQDAYKSVLPRVSCSDVSLLAIDELNSIHPELRKKIYDMILHGYLQELKNNCLYNDLYALSKKIEEKIKNTTNFYAKNKLQRKLEMINNRLMFLCSNCLSFIMISHFYKEVFGISNFYLEVENNEINEKYDSNNFINYDNDIRV